MSETWTCIEDACASPVAPVPNISGEFTMSNVASVSTVSDVCALPTTVSYISDVNCVSSVSAFATAVSTVPDVSTVSDIDCFSTFSDVTCVSTVVVFSTFTDVSAIATVFTLSALFNIFDSCLFLGFLCVDLSSLEARGRLFFAL
ncbi:hypothetical protein GN244_ATG09195 [Phytophthora infestans]|uniref:Uncharacterized protein n=1 Tax=Phytophthora infestans TaxID=4787 RepID=A0A833SUE7_PHYIN|nr:hypothetical protein GN244_ATG09195 [Phytophthora infestans]